MLRAYQITQKQGGEDLCRTDILLNGPADFHATRCLGVARRRPARNATRMASLPAPFLSTKARSLAEAFVGAASHNETQGRGAREPAHAGRRMADQRSEDVPGTLVIL